MTDKSVNPGGQRRFEITVLCTSICVALVWFSFDLIRIFFGVTFSWLGPFPKAFAVMAIGTAIGNVIARRILEKALDSSPEADKVENISVVVVSSVPNRSQDKRASTALVTVEEARRLDEEFARLRDGSSSTPEQHSLEGNPRFQGLWISKKVLAIGACTMLGLVMFTAVSAIQKPSAPQPELVGRNEPDFRKTEQKKPDIEQVEQKKLDIEQKDDLFYHKSGRGWANKLDYDKAIKEYDEAIRINPNNAIFYADRGHAWSQKNNFNSAMKDYNAAIRLDPNNALFYASRGFASSRKNDFENAIKDYDEAIRLDPKNSGLFVNRGFAWYAKKEYEKAIQDYTAAIRLDPNDANAYDNRGTAWWKLQDHDRAIKDYDEAIRLWPNNSSFHFNRGSEWVLKGDVKKAISDFDEALRLNPNNTSASFARDNAIQQREGANRQVRNGSRIQEIVSSIETLDDVVPIYARQQWRSHTNPYRLRKVPGESQRDSFFEYLISMEMNERGRIKSIASKIGSGITVEQYCESRGHPLPQDHRTGAWKRLRDNIAALEYP